MAEVFNLSHEEQDALQEMLKSEKLCYNDISDDGVKLYGVSIKHVHVGYFGFEQFGENALFRSMLVQPDARKRGYGTMIWKEAKKTLKEQGVNSVYLLTNTAEDFFDKQGFAVIERKSVPESIANTTEFREFCPDSSICMKININE
jgi:amino-acid N-acetyltransferase